MGLIPKNIREEIKRRQRFEKARRKRKIGIRTQKVSFLIYCEGECTEPNYFKALIQHNDSKMIETVVCGEGYNTTSLVKKAIKKAEDSPTHYDRIWVVFDKDDFKDFNEAIRYAKKHDVFCAWSNESFELWYYLHFQYLDTGVSRSDYISMIERELRQSTADPQYKYKKNDKNFYSLLQLYGNESQAVKYAKKLQNLYSGQNFAEHKPCTYVNELIDELKHPEKLLD